MGKEEKVISVKKDDASKVVPAIHIKNLVKKYGKLSAVSGISLDIMPGEFFALLGPNGAGKSSTIGSLCGLVNKTSGDVRVFGSDVESDYKLARSRIGLVPQELNMDKFEKVRQVLLFNAGYFGLSGTARIARVDSLLHELGLWSKRDAKVMQLSGGMKRKLMIARALLHNPDILILDEPTAGVDVESRRSIWEYVRKLNLAGKTIFLTTHYIEEAQQLCSRIAIINNGKIIALDSKDKIMKDFGSQEIVVTLSSAIKKLSSEQFGYPVEARGKELIVRVPKGDFDYKKFLKRIIDLPVEKIEMRQTRLEDIFVKLTNTK